MRIAIVHENWGAGAARCARDLQNDLSQRHEVEFYPNGGKETAESLLHCLEQFRPDIVNCHSFYGQYRYSVLAEISNRYPTCFTVHDPRPIGTLETICWNCDHNTWCLRCPMVPGKWRKILKNPYMWQRLKKRLCHSRCASDMVLVAPSRWIGDRLQRQELSRFRTLNVPYGIDTEKFRPMSPSRAHFGLPRDALVLLHSAWHMGEWSINHRKGMQYLAEAFVRHVAPHFPSVVLAVAGERVAPNHPNVFPLGMVDQTELPKLLASIDVFVLPTLADNLPYTILEAMACGKAVVASQVGGIPEQVVVGETGILVPPGDADALGQGLIQLLSDPDKIVEFGQSARLRIERFFGMQRFVETYEELFAKMATSRGTNIVSSEQRVATA